MDNNFRGIATIAVCTALSLPGAFFGLVWLAKILDACSSSYWQSLSNCTSARDWHAAGSVVYVFAWLAYIVLTFTWVKGRKLPRFALIGTALALFYYVPLVATMGWSGLLVLTFLPTVAPAIWLATRALRFHLS